MTFPDGSKYIGQWKEDKKDGLGAFTYPNGGKYEGQWQNDKMSGFGVFTFYDGYIYKGQWKDGNRSGKGIFASPDGRKYKGKWKDGKLIENMKSYKTQRPQLAKVTKDDSKDSETKPEPVVAQQTSEKVDSQAKQSTYPYTVHVSSFKTKEKSNAVAMKLRNEGLPAFTSPAYIPGKGEYYRVFIGFYENFEETKKEALRLKGQEDLYPLEAKLPYAIKVGVFNSDEEMKMIEADLRSKNTLLPYRVPNKNNAAVLVGAFRTKQEAASLTKELQKEGFQTKVVQR
jgi:cell division septation protein DedD